MLDISIIQYLPKEKVWDIIDEEYFNFNGSLSDLQKRKTKSKKKPFSGVLVSQMLAAREAEKQRIVEVKFLLFSPCHF